MNCFELKQFYHSYLHTFQMSCFFIVLWNTMIGTGEAHRKTSDTFYEIMFSPTVLRDKICITFSYSNVLLFWNCTFHTGLCSTRQTYSDISLPHRESQSGNLGHNKVAGSRLFHSWCCYTDVLESPEHLSW